MWDARLDDGYRLLDPPAVPEAAAAAVDDDAVTTWTGDTLELDLRRTQRVRRVVLDTGVHPGPGGYTLSTSSDGTRWQEAATGPGTGQLTTIDIPATQARYLRVELNAPANVVDVRIYR